MTNRSTITSVQLSFITIGSAIMFPYTFLPVVRAQPANQDVWIVTILMFVYIFIINAPLLFLMNKFRGMNMNEIMETILGGVFGKIVSIMFVMLFMFCYTACMLMGVLFMQLFMFPGTPSWALILYIIIPVIYASFKGVGTIGRLSTFVTSFIMVTIIIFFLMGINKMDFNMLQPILVDSKFMELNQGAFLTGSRYSEIIIFLIFSYFLDQRASINKTYASSLIMYAIFLLLIIIPVLTVLGIDLAKHSWNPYFIYTRQVEGFDFIQRVQSVNALAWIIGMLLKLSIYSFMASYVFSGVVKAKTHKSFVIPAAILAFIICLLPIMNKSSTIELLRSDKVFPWIIFPFIFILPLIIVIVYFIRKKKIDDIIRYKQTTPYEVSSQ